MNQLLRILHLEDNQRDAELIETLLKEDGFSAVITRVQTRNEFQTALEMARFDLILSDFTLPSFDGISALRIARAICPEVPYIFVSGTLGEESAIESLRQGAADYVLKDRISRLGASVRRTLAEAEERKARRRVETQLLQRDELFRKVTESVTDLIAVVDVKGRRVFNSPSYSLLLGDPNLTAGSNAFAEVHPEDQERIQRVFAETVATGQGQRTEYRFLARDGSIRYIESQGSVLRGSDNSVSNIVVVSRDITARREADQKLREQAALLDQANDAICATDLDQTITYWNKSAVLLYGWSAPEALGKNITDLVFRGDLSIPTSALKSLFRHHGWHGELEQVTKDGRRIVVDNRWTLLRDGEGTPHSILVINTDITEKRKAERIIEEQAALLNKAQDAIFVRDLDYCITYWNHGAERVYGWTVAEITGRRAADLLYKPSTPERDDIWKAVIEKGEWTGELEQITKSGKLIVVISRRTLLRDAENRPTGILNINTDITEKKEIEAQFLRSQRLESIGALAGGIAHDLNNVLAPIMMAAGMLKDEKLDEFAAKMVESIQASAQRGADMVKQILSFARGGAGDPVLMQIRHLIRDAASLARDTFPRTIRVDVKADEDLNPVLGDPTQFHQILLNLMVNARDAMPDGGNLSIEARNVQLDRRATPMLPDLVTGSFVKTSIADTGTGIPPEALARIFEPFFTTKELGKGTGLGLSTVLNIVKSHKGFIEVASEVGRGTSFHVYLPATSGFHPPAAIAKSEELPLGHGEYILLVDDEFAFLEMTKGMLETFRYQVLTARDGAEALSLYRQHQGRIDLVVTDLMMPILDGATLIRELRLLSPTLKIIGLTGLEPGESIPGAPQIPMNARINKPCTTGTLLITLRNVLEGVRIEDRPSN